MNENYIWKDVLMGAIHVLHNQENVPIAIINYIGNTPDRWSAKVITNNEQVDLPGETNIFNNLEETKQAVENWITANE